MRDTPKKVRPPRRKRADSTEAAIADMRAAVMIIDPPADMPLSNREHVVFNEIIRELPKSEWSEHGVRVAVELARDQVSLDEHKRALKEEGAIIVAANGNPIKNPRAGIVTDLQKTILATRRALAITANAKGGDSRDLGRRRAIQKGNEALHKILEDDDDGLIPGMDDFLMREGYDR